MSKFAGEYVKVVNRHSGKVLDVPERSKDQGVQIIQWDDNGQENQRWLFYKVGDHFCIKSQESSLVLDVGEASKENGAGVIQWPFHGKENQLWKLVEVK